MQVKVKCKQNTWVGFLAQLPAPYLTMYNHIRCTHLLLTVWDSDSKQSKEGLRNCKFPEHSQNHGKDRGTYHHLLVITRAAAYFTARSPRAGVPQALFALHSDNKQKSGTQEPNKSWKSNSRSTFHTSFLQQNEQQQKTVSGLFC